MDKAGGFALGLLTGAMIGLAVGLLYAPQSGEETRRMLREKADDAKEKAANVISKVKESAVSFRGLQAH